MLYILCVNFVLKITYKLIQLPKGAMFGYTNRAALARQALIVELMVAMLPIIHKAEGTNEKNISVKNTIDSVDPLVRIMEFFI